MKNLKIGIIGLGRLGFSHAENISSRIKGAELYAACGSDNVRLEKNQQLLDIPVITTDYDEFINLEELDGIVIASASALHYDQLIRACKAGVKNIFIEKPIALTAEEIAGLEEILPGLNANIQVGHHRRYDPSYIEAKKKIDAGYIGTPISYRNDNRDYYFDPDFFKRFSPGSGGTILDTGSHDYDMVRWLTGAEAKTVYGLGGAYVYDFLPQMGDVDNAALMMDFDNGMMGHFSYSRSCKYAYHVETEIHGTEGVLRICNEPLNNRLISIDEKGSHKTFFKDFYDLYRNCYYDEMVDFLDCIRTGRKSAVSAEDGIKSVKWALKATEAVLGKKVVSLQAEWNPDKQHK
jgi:myo-inositol 2-dehydrogenase/D-chiro-inositol 1-dehydrogenase